MSVQHNEPVAVIARHENGQSDLAVHVARWPTLDRPALVMWQDGSRYSYATPADARRFAAALIQAADKVERETP